MKQGDKKALNYKTGAVKRLLGIKRGEKVVPGTLIKKAQKMKAQRIARDGLV